MNVGIVVEAETDAAVYEKLIRRIRPDTDQVIPRACGGVSGVRQKFVGWLKNFQWHSAYEVHKALVIHDSDCAGADAGEAHLAQLLRESRFQPTFPVHLYTTVCELETWLLADESAVNSVAQQRLKARRARPVPGMLETIRNAKERFAGMLSEAGLPADTTVYAEVATVVDLARVGERCPRFHTFREYVLSEGI
jgi:hypothetical protein